VRSSVNGDPEQSPGLQSGLHGAFDAREAALLHLDVALRAHQVLEQTADLLLGALLAPYLPAGRALPQNWLEEAADLLSASRAKAADHLSSSLFWCVHSMKSDKSAHGALLFKATEREIKELTYLGLKAIAIVKLR